ncbi:GntR family transcriptional regulator [Spirillospora albida]|uniref:GntR family transcriptional regulator n=1 Tax=Spirillospora albida TaxID=58123 RepID=UPI0004C01680|nr:winged helix-turn-helix domain-containing protein [Spirillospora albida]
MIDPEARRPPYLQLADLIRQRIAEGEIPIGRRIPSMTALEAEYGLARNTIQRTLNVLKDEGLIEREPGRGMFVIARPDGEEPAGE